MQGRYIEHEALKTFGGTERITSKSPNHPASILALFREEDSLNGLI